MALGSELAPFFGAAGGAGGAAGFDLSSARFVDDGRATRVPSLMGDPKKWTLSLWFKRAEDLNNTQTLFSVSASDLYFFVRLETNGTLRINNWDAYVSDTILLISNDRFVDVGAWYHLVISVNTNETTDFNRFIVYVNGTQITSWASAGYPARYLDTYVNSRFSHILGANGATQYFDGYISNVQFVDGQQLGPSSFAATNELTYAYEPIPFEGDYITPGGTPNDGTVWSNYVTSSPALSGSYPATNLFDSSFTTAAASELSFGSVGTITFTPPSPIPASTLRLRAYARAVGTATISVNGGSAKTLVAGTPQVGTFDVSELITGGQITSISYTFNYNISNTGGEFNQLYGFIVDNVLLQDGITTNTVVTQSFALNFTNTSTSSALFADSSGTGNDWTPSNINTASSSYASNLDPSATAYPNTTLSNGGLTWSGSTVNDTGTVSSIPIPTNKKTYVEVTHTTTGGGDPGPGVANTPDVELGLDTIKAWWRGGTNGGVSASTIGPFTGTNTTWSNGDVLGIALDPDANSGAGSITFYKNGVAALTGGSGWTSYPGLRFEWQNNGTGTDSGTWNYGTTAFSFPLTGYTGLYETVNDAATDSPLITGTYTGSGGDIKGNYCLWDELTVNGRNATVTTSPVDEAGLKFSHRGGVSTWDMRVGTIGVTSGKWYYEVRYSGGINTQPNFLVGWCNPFEQNFGDAVGNNYRSYGYYSTGNVRTNNGNTAFGDTWTSGDVIGCALDLDNLKIYWSKNGVWQNGADPAAGTGSIYTVISPSSAPFCRYHPAASLFYAGSSCTANFGQFAWVHQAPEGFKSLCTANLTDPTVLRPEDYFEPVKYNGSSPGSYSSLLFQPEFVWLKARNANESHFLFDSLRTATWKLESDTTLQNAQQTQSLTSFDTNGFTWGSFGPMAQSSMAGWCWDATGVSETNYDPKSTGAPVNYVGNPTTGFSIVQVPNPNNSSTRSHGCGAPVEFIIAKATASNSEQWHLYHRALGRTYYGLFTDGAWNVSDQWGGDEPTSTEFYVKPNTASGANFAGGMIYYLWAGVEGYSRFGYYVGTGGATTSPFINCGFRPAYVLIKRSDGIAEWVVTDNARNGYNRSNPGLFPNRNYSESTIGNITYIDLCSNGFKIRSNSSEVNDTNGSYLYCAFAEHPFKYTNAR